MRSWTESPSPCSGGSPDGYCFLSQKVQTVCKVAAKQSDVLQKPHGIIHPRVQKVGPEHFGIVSVDCAKARSKWMLTDFYGNVHIAPTVVEHNQCALQAAMEQIRVALLKHAIVDLIVAIERTGQYHHAVQRAFRSVGFETRIVHPFECEKSVKFRLLSVIWPVGSLACLGVSTVQSEVSGGATPT